MRPRLPRAVGSLLRLTLVAALFALPATAASRALTVDDVLRLHAAGVHEDVIISEIIVTDTVFELDVEDILRLQEAGVSDRLLQFMVDTGIPASDGEAGEALVGESPTQAEEDTRESDGGGSSSSLFVSLRWGYPVWWYDVYWWDYWYYDCHYSPWYVSWSYPCGAWYPTWYGYGGCWISPAWGYRYAWWSGGYGSWVAWSWGPSYWYGPGWGHYPTYPVYPAPRLSDWKYKTAYGASGKTLVAGAGLRVPDGSRVLSDRKPSLRMTDGKVRLVGGKQPADDRQIRSVRGSKTTVSTGLSDGLRRPAKPSGQAVVRSADDTRRPVRPVRPVRRPAAADRPVKKTVRQTDAAPRDPAVRPSPSGRDTAPRSVDKPRGEVRSAPKGKSPKVKQASPAPRPDAVPAPRVEARPPSRSSPSPPPRSSSGGKSPPPSGGGRSGGSGKSRGR